MKQLLHTIFLVAVTSIPLTAQDHSIFPKGEISTTDNHTGTVWLKELNGADSIFNYSIAVATFVPSAKLDWHIHPAGQILLITEGTGYYQEKGKPIQIVRKGDVVKCLPKVEHWHGATPESSFAYLATTPAQKGKTVWLKRVTDAEYNSLKSQIKDGTTKEQEIINLSKKKWLWMADKNVDSLNVLFNEKSIFGIHYKQADIQETSVQLMGNTAVLLNKIRLVAVVGGNEVVNPFMVTEVYVRQDNTWTLGSLSFTKLLTP
jgi:4-carboxymuconolactone decarboxylase